MNSFKMEQEAESNTAALFKLKLIILLYSRSLTDNEQSLSGDTEKHC